MFKKNSFSSLLPAAVFASSLFAGVSASASIITLDFEGIAPHPSSNNILIGNYYNGGAASNGAIGPNLGIIFSTGANLLCLNTLTASCSNTSKGGLGIPTSQLGAMFFPLTNPIMDIAAGFDTGFSMTFSNPHKVSIGIEVWDDLNASGNLLASAGLPSTPNGAEGTPALCEAYGSPNYCTFGNFSLGFSGVAKSVRFTGLANVSVYDDFTFGSLTPGGGGNGQIPEPASLALLGIGLAGLGFTRRRQRA